MLVLDVVEVLRVVLGDVDGVVRQVEFAFDAEIHHEGGAGILLLRELLVRPATAKVVGNKTFHRAGEIGVDHHRIGAMRAVAVVRTPTARLPAKRISSTGSFRQISTPRRSATRAIAAVIAEQPPMG